MTTWEQFAVDTLRTGAVAGVATTAAAAACGQLEDENPIAPLNAISHIAWGDEAAKEDELSWKYTFTGLATHAAAMGAWAAVHELLARRAAKRGDVTRVLLTGAFVSALAYVTDYKVVPERLTPGFEKRLSPRSLLAVYSVLAASLGVGTLLRGSRRSAR